MRVPTDRANNARRRNAEKSTGPRSETGLQRVGGNARTHGLSVPLDDPEGILARYRALTGNPAARLPLETADGVSRAALDLARAEAELERVRAALAPIDREIEAQVQRLSVPEVEAAETLPAPSIPFLLALESLDRRARLMRYLRAAERRQERTLKAYRGARDRVRRSDSLPD